MAWHGMWREGGAEAQLGSGLTNKDGQKPCAQCGDVGGHTTALLSWVGFCGDFDGCLDVSISC